MPEHTILPKNNCPLLFAGLCKMDLGNLEKESDLISALQAEIDSLKAEKGMADMEIKRLEAENDKLRFALKSSIEVTEGFEKIIHAMNKLGLRFRIKPFRLPPVPAFIKETLEGEPK